MFPSISVDLSLGVIHGFYNLKEGALIKKIEDVIKPESKIEITLIWKNRCKICEYLFDRNF